MVELLNCILGPSNLRVGLEAGPLAALLVRFLCYKEDIGLFKNKKMAIETYKVRSESNT